MMTTRTTIVLALLAGLALTTSPSNAKDPIPTVPIKLVPQKPIPPYVLKARAVAMPEDAVQVAMTLHKQDAVGKVTETLSSPRVTIQQGQTGMISVGTSVGRAGGQTGKSGKLESGLSITIAVPVKGEAVCILVVMMDKGKIVWADAQKVKITPAKKPKP